MTRFIAIGMLAAASLALAAPATAADLPVKAPPAPQAPYYNWNGFYIGAHGGYGWQDVDSKSFDSTGALAASESFRRKGWFAGGQAGYNWMVTPSFLLGIEGDFSGGDISGDFTACTATGCATSHTKFNELATIRGRLGFAVNNWLFYGTGGWAWSHSDTDRTVVCVVAGGGTCPGGPSPSALTGQVASDSGGKGGWTAGGGIEWGFLPNWSAKIEYQHLEFDNVSRNFTYPGFPTAFRRIVTDNSTDTVRFGLNYRFGGPVVARY